MEKLTSYRLLGSCIHSPSILGVRSAPPNILTSLTAYSLGPILISAQSGLPKNSSGSGLLPVTVKLKSSGPPKLKAFRHRKIMTFKYQVDSHDK
jgi:hypothetical protein